MDDIGSTTYLLILVLLMLSAFFSASETAFSAANMIRLRTMAEDGNKRAAQAVKVAAQYDKLIATILIGNNLVNIAISSLVTVIATAYFKNYAVAVATGISTLVVLTFGEIIPKSFAKMNAESISMAFAGVLRILMVIFTPFSFLFLRLMQPFKKKEDGEEQPTITEQELMYMLDTTEEEGVLEEQEKELVQSALEFNDTTVEDILTPRVQVVAVEERDTLEEISDKFLQNGYSRMLVYRHTIDTLLGVIHEKDFYTLLHEGGTDLSAIIQEVPCVPTGMKISALLRQLQRDKAHLAAVVDEFGGTCGIVTMEDILEEIVGNIMDEYDEDQEYIKNRGKGEYVMEGKTPLKEVEELLDITFDEEEFETLNGFLISRLDRIPEPDEQFDVDYKGYNFKILSVVKKMIGSVLVKKLPEEKTLENAEDGQSVLEEKQK